jgi:glutamate carboxypeptidase
VSELFAYLDAAAAEQLQLLERLVNIDSGTYHKAGVDQVGALLAAELKDLGLTCATVPQAELGDHLVGRKAGTSGRDLLLVGHMDTVFPKGTPQQRPFRVEDGRAYGPGVYDMKGGLSVIIYALKALKATNPVLWEELGIRVVFNSDEEIGSDTSRELIAGEAQQSAAACVLEPARAGGEYVRQRKGVGMFKLTVRGKSAHAGAQPELGANAVADLAHKVALLHGLTNFETGLTVNVGAIRGGDRANVVPDFAEAEIDVRVTSLAMREAVTAELQRIAGTVHVPGTAAVLTGEFKHAPMEYTPGIQRLFAILEQAGAEVGFTVKNVATGGGSDGNTTSQYAPTMDGMGPRGNFAHSANEFVETDSLSERTKALARFIERWLAAEKA